ncbi:outer membrane protein [Salipiger mucosus]|uniref:Putative outer membrane protein n=1 Tax=Salipiger mucosus DSM 16094 TaxID=1123237 RepID=S9QDZ3_9RHOB|nr:outer membrane beta-barrel protein [Salipiger mucosus]EPX79646.1 putative outer membrane protein [Salipiger mucosus DSM 16094]
MTFKPLILVPFLATPAFAGSLDTAQPEPAPAAPVAPVAATPTYDWSGPSVGVQLGYGNLDADDPIDSEDDGALYGARAFYDYDFGNWVAGGGVQYDGADIEMGDGATLNGIGKIGGRAGYDLGRTMVYGTGGYAHAFTDDDDIDPGDSGGYYVGIGAEHFVTENVTVSGEVAYNKFDDFDDTDLEVDATTTTVGLNYRF